MEIRWTFLAAVWRVTSLTKRAWNRVKKNYHYIGIISIMAAAMCVYMYEWQKNVETEDHTLLIPTSTHVYPESGCHFPNIDPFSEIALKYTKDEPKIVCDGIDWVECNMTECKVIQHILDTMKNIECIYKDIIYLDEHNYLIAAPVKLVNDEIYKLNRSDYFKVSCSGYDKNGFGILAKRWHGYKSGIRPVVLLPSPPGRENSINVLVISFDSASRNGFIRKMPRSYKFLTKDLEAVILTGYNIVGDGTPDALFPILSGRTELQHPLARTRYVKNAFLDPDLFIFHTAQEDGYQTAYLEDMPWIGSFQWRYNGFSKRPADHYLRSFLMEETKDGSKWWKGVKGRYCIGATPQYLFLLNLTRQFMRLKNKRFCFTFIADISHDDFNLISTADDDLVDFLRDMKIDGKLEDTLLIVMGDHGPRFSPMRMTYQGKMEERMAFMSILLPEKLKRDRPDALFSLRTNADVLTTPFDIHTTILDAMGLKEFASDFVVPNAEIPRGLSLLKPIPRSRTCDEAGVLPHWCVCLNTKWNNVLTADRMYARAANALVVYINGITDEKRDMCIERKLVSIEWVIRQDTKGKTADYGKTPQSIYYQAMIVMSPGRAVFEGSMQYFQKLDRFVISDKDVSRISRYGKEPACISATHPHLNKFCYCKANAYLL